MIVMIILQNDKCNYNSSDYEYDHYTFKYHFHLSTHENYMKSMISTRCPVERCNFIFVNSIHVYVFHYITICEQISGEIVIFYTFCC